MTFKKTVVVMASAILSACAGTPPENLGVHDGKLQECPDSPNCVCTQSASDSHRVMPLTVAADVERNAVMTAVTEVVETFDRATIISQEADYLRAEFATRMGFVDDVEFYFDGSGRQLHFRSASRLGHSDMGLNRKRYETLRGELLKRAEVFVAE